MSSPFYRSLLTEVLPASSFSLASINKEFVNIYGGSSRFYNPCETAGEGSFNRPTRRLSFYKALIFLLLFAFAILPSGAKAASPAPGEVGELWQGKVLTASFRAGMCFDSKGKARGVLLLRHRTGQQDAYHLYGSIRNNEFNLYHSSGHQFTGRLTGPETMEGSVRLANGMKLNLEGKRIRNARLEGDDCSPPTQ